MLRFTRHGFREMLIGSLVLVIIGTVTGWASGVWLLGLLVVPVLVWLFAFFRDPERSIPVEQNAMVSPADGRISDITELPHHELLDAPCVRIGIFLSVFNVHMNRSPCDAKVLDVREKRGRFINAMRHNEASEHNESKTVVLGEPGSGRPIAVVKLIVGMIARRIIFSPRVGETVRRGQRIGMIKFGSRTELYIAKWLDPQVRVTVGQSVRGGQDVIALLGHPICSRETRVDDEEFEPLVGRETPA
jgi:phosphatidylserine decarboxylase